MANSNSFYSPSSTIVLPPNLDQYFSSNHYVSAINTNQPVANGFADTSPSNASIPPTPGSIAGRKRSRGDIHAPEDDDELEGSKPVHTPSPPQAHEEPIYGPGMTVIYPGQVGYTQAAQSQSGTWTDESAERKHFHFSHMKRPSINSRKSQRMASTPAGTDDLAQLLLPSDMRDATSEPLIDEATRTLGISWTRMDSTEPLRINQTAYSKFIQNHYRGLEEVKVWFENSALPGYLVVARNSFNGMSEYYIFSHDLLEARLITNEPSQLIPRLQMLPALHLAAPGGCLRADSHSATATRADANDAAEQDTVASEPVGMCAAHSMEVD